MISNSYILLAPAILYSFRIRGVLEMFNAEFSKNFRLTKDSNLYGEKLIKIPKPQFVVFYNGADPMPESSVVRLSEAFDSAEDGDP